MKKASRGIKPTRASKKSRRLHGIVLQGGAQREYVRGRAARAAPTFEVTGLRVTIRGEGGQFFPVGTVSASGTSRVAQ